MIDELELVRWQGAVESRVSELERRMNTVSMLIEPVSATLARLNASVSELERRMNNINEHVEKSSSTLARLDVAVARLTVRLGTWIAIASIIMAAAVRLATRI